VRAWALVAIAAILCLLPDVGLAQAPDPAPEPFLITPYYGSRSITAYFDHRYPTYSSAPNISYDRVVRHDGADLADCWQVGSGQPCTWYDGHNGTDYSIQYDRVLAAASGTVTFAGWQDPNCHNGYSCGYGLYVMI
jgi:murein DD-endopeptidase MepM/ murein hydrolase activator NlpD